jgi:hypothetical protein
MPRIIDYATVVELLTREGFKSLYFNSGAFGFAAGVETISRGWIGEPDRSIREAAIPMIRQVGEPVVPRLVSGLMQVWRQDLPGAVWVMPKSHWAFEFEFGSRDWMPTAMDRIGVDWRQLAPLNISPAIEFQSSDAGPFEYFAGELLTHLAQSDFQLIFPGLRTICTVHSRKQLWWTTADPKVAAGLDRVLPAPKSEISNFK